MTKQEPTSTDVIHKNKDKAIEQIISIENKRLDLQGKKLDIELARANNDNNFLDIQLQENDNIRK